MSDMSLEAMSLTVQVAHLQSKLASVTRERAAKWISVEEILPPADAWVLLVEIPDSVGVHIGQMDKGNRFWIWEAKDIWPSNPTHWMAPTSIPLPAPPKEAPGGPDNAK